MRSSERRLLGAVVLTVCTTVVGTPLAPASTAGAVVLPTDVTWTPLGAPVRGQQAGDRAGSSVAASADGHVVAIGAPGHATPGGDAGTVRVMVWNGTSWQQRGAAFTTISNQRLGELVDVSADGDTIAFSAPGTVGSAGRVEVHRWIDGAWSALGVPFTGGAGDRLGTMALSADGNTLAVGSPLDDGAGNDAGSVRVFTWDGAAWRQRGATLLGAADDTFGTSVAIASDGATVVVGAPGGDRGGANRGDALVYDWTGTAWQPRGAVTSGAALNDQYGTSVAVDETGTTVAIGATSGQGARGTVTVIRWTGTAWQRRGADLVGSAVTDHFGQAVALDAAGDSLAVSSPGFGGVNATGRVGVYDWDGATWQARSWPVEGVAPLDGLYDVDLSSDGATLVVGKAGDDGTGADAGSVEVYASATPRPWGSPVIGHAPGASAGFATALDADGDTMAVGMPNLAAGATVPGRVEVLRMVEGTWTRLGTPLVGDSVGDRFGAAVALDAAGDTLVVGAPRADDAGADAGRVRIYDWNGTTWALRGAALDGAAAGDALGASVDISAAGLVVAVGAPEADAGPTADAGNTRVWNWDGTTWVGRGIVAEGADVNDWSGASVALSGDGTSIVVGEPYYDQQPIIIGPPQPNAVVAPAFITINSGRARVFDWNGAAWQLRGAELLGLGSFDDFGTSVAIDDDGSTVAVGAPGSDAAGADAGATEIHDWIGGNWVLRGTALDGEAAGDLCGTAVALSNDGNVLAMGAPRNSADRGQVRLRRFDGGAWRQLGSDLDGATLGEKAGTAVAMSGDGTALAIGAPERLGPQPLDGAATAFRIGRRSTPGQPTSVTVASVGADRLRAMWSRQPTDLQDPVTDSELQVSTDGGTTWGAATWSGTDPMGTELTGLTASTSYRVRVRDGNTTGWGPWRTSLAVLTASAPLSDALPGLVTRRSTTVISGGDAFELAVAVSRELFRSTADTVHVITAQTFPDAVMGGLVAHQATGPVLLTERDRIPAVTRAEIRRLQPARIVIVGGVQAVSPGVARQLGLLAPTVTRLGGADRYATAASIALSVQRADVDVVYLASGARHGDAMVVAPLAAARRAPLLLTSGHSLPLATEQALRSLVPRRVVVVGGAQVISEAVVRTLRTLVPVVERLAGPDQGGTALAIADQLAAAGEGPVLMVDRRRAGDGLVLTPFAVARQSAVLTIDGSCTPRSVADHLRRRSADVVLVTTLSRERAVSALDTVCR